MITRRIIQMLCRHRRWWWIGRDCRRCQDCGIIARYFRVNELEGRS